LQPEVKPVIKPDKTTPLKKSVVRNIKSRTKKGTLFKPSELDETGSMASFLHSSIAASVASEPPQMEEIQQMETRAAKTAAQRLDAQHKRQSKEEKKLENRLYALKGTGGKKGAIKLAEDNLMRLNAELTTGPKAAKQKQIEGSITRLTKALENMKIELPNVEAKLTTIRASRTPIKRGRPAGITGFVSSLFSPAQV
jgi:predicted RNase H-like nuclease (RuvC/YqgF family)